MLRASNAPTCWVLTDGKAGDEVQALSVAEALGLHPEIRRVKPRAPFTWAMPWGPIDPRERPSVPGSPLAPPYPDLLIASGRRAVPSLRFVRRASQGRTFTVFLKDPRTGAGAADFIWSPDYDRLRGPNVLNTTTPPHRVSAARIAAARLRPDPRLAAIRAPRVAVLAGGDSRHHRFTEGDVARLLRDLLAVAEGGAGLMITSSRRTPAALRDGLAALARAHGGFYWDGTGENPYVVLLALADFIVVTADSANMVGEAAASGRPVLVFSPSGGHPKLEVFLKSLEDQGIVHAFRGSLVGAPYEPLNSTLRIAGAIARAFAQHRRALGLPDLALPLETA